MAATTGVVAARKRRDHTQYDPDELRDRLHSRVADAADADTDASVDKTWPAPAEADTAVHTAPHGDKAAEAPVDEPAPEQPPAPADGDEAQAAAADEPAT